MSNQDKMAAWISFHQEISENITHAQSVKELKKHDLTSIEVRQAMNRDINEWNFTAEERALYFQEVVIAHGEATIAYVTACERLKDSSYIKIIYLTEQVNMIKSSVLPTCTKEEIIEKMNAGVQCLLEGVDMVSDLSYLGNSQDLYILTNACDDLNKRIRYVLSPFGKKKIRFYQLELEKKIIDNSAGAT